MQRVFVEKLLELYHGLKTIVEVELSWLYDLVIQDSKLEALGKKLIK
jgi:hypothetical protein